MKTPGPPSNWQSARSLAGAISMARLAKLARVPGRKLTGQERQFDGFYKFLLDQFDRAAKAEKLTKEQIDGLLDSIETRVAEARADIAERN